MRAVKLKKTSTNFSRKTPANIRKTQKVVVAVSNSASYGLFNVEVMKRSLRKAQSRWKSLKPLESETRIFKEKEGPGTYILFYYLFCSILLYYYCIIL